MPLTGLIGSRRQEDLASTLLEAAGDTSRHAYRMKVWPDLPVHLRTGPVLRTLSRMSCGPVTHDWVLGHCKLPAAEAEQLLARLVAQDCAERIELERVE
jgi:hypothetical protein